MTTRGVLDEGTRKGALKEDRFLVKEAKTHCRSRGARMGGQERDKKRSKDGSKSDQGSQQFI